MTMNRTLCTCLIVLAAAVLAGAQPRTAAELFRSGMEALAAEHYDEAEQDFRAAVKMDPLYDAAFYGLGQVYMATKRYERAVQLLGTVPVASAVLGTAAGGPAGRAITSRASPSQSIRTSVTARRLPEDSPLRHSDARERE